MDILMPQLGETVTEGTIIRWYKAEGDTIAAGEPLFEIETDKTSMEVPATAPGVLSKIRAQVGATVPVGAVVALVTRPGEASTAGDATVAGTSPAQATIARFAATPAPDARPMHAAAPATAPAAASTWPPLDPFQSVRTPEGHFGSARLPGGARISPRARRLAHEQGIEPGSLAGSGPQGRVVAADVPVAPSAVAVVAPGTGTGRARIKAQYPVGSYREVALDSMRRAIARRLVEAKQTVPHFYLTAELNVEALLSLRTQLNAAAPVKISINDLLVKAYALALQQVPAANVAWADDCLLQFERSDVAVAVAVPGGLVTPVVRSADVKSIVAVATEIAELAGRGRERRLRPEEYQGGAATVSNLGMYGVRSFSAIINPPQATILAVGAAERRPIEAPDGSLRFASLLTVTLSVDHRAVDGAVGGELLRALRVLVEHPVRIQL
jgi:pyruvate dehydrogenase E2 component (dihydrolipoamide acetyltransferase)